MPPRSVCLNVFTTSLGESSAAVREDGSFAGTSRPYNSMMRRDSAFGDIPRRASDGSVASAPTPTSTSPSPSPIPAVNRAELFNTLRPMASTESMNIALTSKPCTTCSGGPARRRCSRCKSAYYCDRNCQKTDWKTHRSVCEPAVQNIYSAPATPNFSNPTSPITEA